MQPDILDMLRDDVRAADAQRQRNRERFPFAAEMLDALKAGGIDARIVYAENAAGETIGKRDPGPWCEYLPNGVRAMDAHRRWFGVVNRQPEAAPKRRAMTDAQCACLRGDV
ncbi:MAG: hypothetical protein KGL39_57140 [Patescibacteria group bacterium]|nr:hypothetical protein [Patescibacteria group bacterium]